jgi:outer membrane protein assembly factor BamB
MSRPIALVVLGVLLAVGCTKPIELEWSFASGSGSRSTPAVTHEVVVFGNEAGYVNAVNRDGSARWRFATTKEVVSAPTVDGPRVYFGSTNYTFYALDLASGRSLWEFATGDRIKGDPTISEGVVYFGSYDGHFYALGAADRRVVWEFPPATPPAPPPAAAKGVAAGPDAGSLVPADLPKGFSYAQPAIAQGVVYIGNLDGNLYALEAGNGALRWKFKTGDGITSSATVLGGVIYFGSNDKKVYALDQATGTQVRWAFATGDAVNAPPLVEGGIVYVGSTDHLFYALDAATGKKLWSASLQGPIYGKAALYKNLVFVGGGPGDGAIYAFDAKSGQPFWKYQTGGKVESDVVVDGDHAFAVGGDGQLLSFKINKTETDHH